MSQDASVAIVGAGIAGATATRYLSERGVSVDCFEKSRGTGGRSSTRRIGDNQGRMFHFDHGAQYFTVKDSTFGATVENLRRKNQVAQWNPSLAVIEDDSIQYKDESTIRYVGVPGMSSLSSAFLADHDPSLSTRVDSIETIGDGVKLSFATKPPEDYNSVILTAPPAQSADLVGGTSDLILSTCESVQLDPTWAVLLGFKSPLDLPFEAAFVNSEPIGWIANNSSKPGRPDAESWVLHASSSWSKNNSTLDTTSVTETLTRHFERITDSTLPEPAYSDAHFWRYARAESPRDDRSVFDPEAGVGVAGDWLAGNRIEGAFLSGRSAASKCLAS